MSKPRIIAHFDLDSFFVSVEVLKDPSLKGKPVIVGGRERGVVAACSYEARKFGIHSAMPSRQAMQLCPHAIVIKGSYADYSHYSRMVTSIIAESAPLFEKASIDEFYLDLTGMDTYFEPLQWTIDLRRKIINDTGLPISFGLSTNKMMAKIATNQAKPNGYLYVPAGKEKDFLSSLPVEEIPGVGKHTKEVLHAMGIFRISTLQETGKELLEEKFGKWGTDLWQKCQGIHDREVSSWHEAKSISTENTFSENLVNTDDIRKELVRQAEKVCYELRQDGLVTGCVAVKIRYPDFETVTKQSSIPYTAADDEIIPVLKNLFSQLHKRGHPLRLLGVRLSDLTRDAVQTSLFSDAAKKSKLYKAVDGIKGRFGTTKVKRASGK